MSLYGQLFSVMHHFPSCFMIFLPWYLRFSGQKGHLPSFSMRCKTLRYSSLFANLVLTTGFPFIYSVHYNLFCFLGILVYYVGKVKQ